MSLCTLCESIDLLAIPKLPPSCNAYNTKNEFPELISVIKRNTNANKAQEQDEPLGIPFHQTLEALEAAATTCSICKVVSQDAEQFRITFSSPEYEEARLIKREKGPDWKMYVAKGPNEISGFLVVAHDVERRSVVWVVSAVGLGVDDDDALAGVVAGRKISVDAVEQKTVKRAIKWIEECDTKHGCVVDGANLPARVLDVSKSEVSILVTKGEKGKYAALSYVSDTDPSEATGQKISKTSIDMDTLPQILRDAITMTRKLGIRYLWIDALCNDLPHSLPAYVSIFSNAYLTLSATSSPSPTHGMLSPRSPPPSQTFQYSYTTTTTGTLHASPVPREPSLHPSNDRILSSPALSQDPWSLQERLFSPRILHLCAEQMYFECNVHFLSETGFFMPGRTDTLDASTRTFKSETDEEAARILLWQNILNMYCRRPLTRPEDKLPALSNLASHLAHDGDMYVAGLWRSRLISELVWQATGFARGRTSESSVYRSPSWSWASIDGPFGMFTPGLGSDKGGWVDFATVLDCHVTLKNEEEPFGEVEDAWVKIRTPLEELVPCEDAPRKQVWKMKTRNGGGEGTIVILDTLARAEKAKKAKLYAAVLTRGGRVKQADYHAVVVAQVKGKEGTYERLGKMSFGEEELGKYEWMGSEEGKVDVVLV